MFGNIENPIEQEVNGVVYKQIQAGQKRRYGDSFYDYVVKSDLPSEKVEQICTASVRECGLKYSDWLADERNPETRSMDNHFRLHYKFEKRADGSYFYSVISPSTH